MKKNLFIILALLFFCGLCTKVTAQSAPYFVYGHTQRVSVCAGGAALALNSQLAVMDSSIGDTEIWSLLASPSHGAVAASYTTTSTGGVLTPTGLTYTSLGSYSGADTFAILVSDGSLADTTVIYVNIIPVPVAGIISGPSSVCIGSTITLTESVSGGSWSVSNGNASITGSGIVSGISSGLDTANYFVVNSCGFASAASVIAINTLPTVGTISGAAALCLGSSITLTATSSGGSWSASNTSTSVLAGVVTAITAGIDTITYTIANSCGTVYTTHVVTVDSTPYVSAIAGPSVVCTGASTTLTDSVSGGIWSASNATATLSAGVVTGVTPGTDTISYSITNSCGSIATTHIISIDASPNAGIISGPASVCQGDSVVLTDTVAGGTWSVTNSHASLSGSVLHGNTSGIDTVNYSVTNTCGTSVATYIISVASPLRAGPITGTHEMCIHHQLVLGAPTVGGTWVVSNTNASIAGDTVTGVAGGRDTVLHMVSNVCGADTAYFFVRVDSAAPVLSAIAGPSSLCVGDSVFLTDSVSGGTWRSLHTGTAVVNSAGRVRGVAAGMDTIFYTMGNTCGSDTALHLITVNPRAVAGPITGFDSVCAGSTITLAAAGTTGSWTSGSPDFATIDATGHVYGVLNGSTIISYSATNACGTSVATHRVTINIPAQPITGDPIICRSTLASPIPALFFDEVTNGTWTSSNFLVAAPITGGTVIGLTTGYATLTYTVRNACGTSTATIDVQVVNCANLSVAEPARLAQTLSIAPNPNSGSFSVLVNTDQNEMLSATILDVTGKVLSNVDIVPNCQNPLQLTLAPGIYLFSVETRFGRLQEKILVTERS